VKALAPTETRVSWLVQAINQLIQGRNNVSGTVTLTLNAATTTVTNPAISASSQPQLFPKTANAATELGAGGMYVSAVAAGSFTITHVNSATASRTFGWVALGG
jgi:hypothetical protein